MFWYIIIGGSILSAIFAFTKGQNPLIWALTSVPGVPLLALFPDKKKLLPEQRRARRSVGDKLGLVTGGAVIAIAVVLKIVGVV